MKYAVIKCSRAGRACARHQLSANMAVTAISFRWLDILEKEFDEAFVDLDILIGTHICA
jgi:hypothetical protein